MDQMRSKVDRKLEDSRSGALSPNGTSSNVTSSNGLTQPDATSVGDDNISPGLARLRNTPGQLRGKLCNISVFPYVLTVESIVCTTLHVYFSSVGVFKARQELLVRKHADARARADSLSGVGGGVSLWPCMARMRLTREEGAALVVVSVALVLLSVAAFRFLHGEAGWTQNWVGVGASFWSFLFCIEFPVAVYPVTSKRSAANMEFGVHVKTPVLSEFNSLLWPRLSKRCNIGTLFHFLQLPFSFLTLVLLIPGNLQWNMLQFYDRVSQFNAGHPVEIHSGGEAFNSSLLRWHTAYLALVVSYHGGTLPTSFLR